MCIIVCKEKGQAMPNEDILENCFVRNNDGAGFAYNINGKVKIEKGFLTFKDLKKALEKLESETDIKKIGLVIHFRIGTAGTNGAGNTHPYPLTNNWKQYKQTELITNVAVFHNGIIAGYSPNKENKNDFNDTQLYILKRLSKLPKEFYKNKKTLEKIGQETKNRFAFIDGDGNIYRTGDGWQIDDNIYYSNNTYKKYNYLYDFDGFYNHDRLYNLDNMDGDYFFDTFEEMGAFLDLLFPIMPNSEIYTDSSYKNSFFVDENDVLFCDEKTKTLFCVDFFALCLQNLGHFHDIVEY